MATRASSLLAVVPAYNEAGSVAKVVRSLRERAPRFDVIVVDDGSTDDTADRARAAGARGGQAAVQPRHRRRRADRVRVRARARLRLHGPGRRRRAARAGRAGDAAGGDRRATRALDMVCGSRFLSPESSYPAPISRRTGIHLFAFTLSKILGQRVTDPTSGFRLYNRRAIGLFARDYPHDYPEVEAVLMLHAHRLRMTGGAGADAPARLGPLLDHHAALGLLHDQGLAGAAGRPDAPPQRRRAGRSRPRVGEPRGVTCTSALSWPRSCSPRIVFLLVFEMVRRRYLRERYAILWLGAALALLVLAVWTELLSTISQAVGIATPSNAFFVIAFAFLLLLLLHFSAVVSRLADETRVLAQRLALLEQRQRKLETDPESPQPPRQEPDWIDDRSRRAATAHAGGQPSVDDDTGRGRARRSPGALA